jgi:hypothetical protein
MQLTVWDPMQFQKMMLAIAMIRKEMELDFHLQEGRGVIYA